MQPPDLQERPGSVSRAPELRGTQGSSRTSNSPVLSSRPGAGSVTPIESSNSTASAASDPPPNDARRCRPCRNRSDRQYRNEPTSSTAPSPSPPGRRPPVGVGPASVLVPAATPAMLSDLLGSSGSAVIVSPNPVIAGLCRSVWVVPGPVPIREVLSSTRERRSRERWPAPAS
jgi:hypothetical protein